MVLGYSGNFVLRGEDCYILINDLCLYFEPRPSKTGRDEGGLLCVKK